MRNAAWCVAVVFLVSGVASAGDWMDEVSHEYVDNDGVKIHYAKAGQGPLVVFIHGFPDFWYTWRHQMRALAPDHTVVAMDTRGYNKSDKPEGAENYDMRFLVSDVAAVIRNEGVEKAVIVGHDWGGGIAWSFAATMPQMTDKLIIINLPHMKALHRELINNPMQHANSAYARSFQQPDSHKRLSAPALASMLAKGDEDLKAKYLTAFENSSFDAMMNYYRQNYPKMPYEDNPVELPDIQCPVLQFHGLADSVLLPGALNNTWDYLKQDWTLVTLPGVGHWAHIEKADLVSETMRCWLKIRE